MEIRDWSETGKGAGGKEIDHFCLTLSVLCCCNRDPEVGCFSVGSCFGSLQRMLFGDTNYNI